MLHPRQLPRHRLAGVVIAALIATVAPATPAFAADPVQISFAFTGAEQTFVVPTGVNEVDVVLVGGAGGAGTTGNAAGGRGQRVDGTLGVEPGTTLYIEVAGNGGVGALNQACVPGAAGFNGGAPGGSGLGEAPLTGPTCGFAAGGGGGASDIRSVTRTDPDSLNSRLIVAAGGGGGGGGSGAGPGGNAGSNGASGGAIGGGAGSSTGGGAGGPGHAGGGAGGDGGTGQGGAGGEGLWAGGGGGGGLYGGGGGGSSNNGTSGGGGGGSSFTGSATNVSSAVDPSGTPSITVSYVPSAATPDPGTGVVDAAISMADSTVCIELSTASVDFGTGQFGQVGVVGSPAIVVTNCSDIGVRLYGRGSDATGTGAAWTLLNNASTCADTLGVDNFHLGLRENQADLNWRLGTSNTELEDIAAGSPGDFSATIDTACPGSTGAGQQMSMQIVFVATAAP